MTKRNKKAADIGAMCKAPLIKAKPVKIKRQILSVLFLKIANGVSKQKKGLNLSRFIKFQILKTH